MNIEVRPINDDIYATHLDMQDDFLGWIARGYEWIMLIQTSFGSEFDLDESFIRRLSEINSSQLFSEDGNNVNGVMVRFIPNGLIQNFRIPVRPATYAVFATKKDPATGALCIYKPGNDDHFCSVSKSIEIKVMPHIIKKPLIRNPFVKFDDTPKKEIFIQQVFPYEDGSIYYSFAGNDGRNYKYPVVFDMLGKKLIVNERTGFELRFHTKNTGYQIKLKKTAG